MIVRSGVFIKSLMNIRTIQSVLIVTERFCKNTLLFYFHILISDTITSLSKK